MGSAASRGICSGLIDENTKPRPEWDYSVTKWNLLGDEVGPTR